MSLEKKTTYQIIKIADVLNGNAVLNLIGQAQIDFLKEVNNKVWVSEESIMELINKIPSKKGVLFREEGELILKEDLLKGFEEL